MIAVAALFVGGTASAQEVDYEKGYTFLGIKGGAQATLTHYKFTDLITPQYGIYFGGYFNQYVGARLDITGFQNKGGFRADRYDFVTEDTPYKFKACTADADLLMNFTNILCPHRTSHVFNWNLLVGFGVNLTWDNAEFNKAVNSFKYYVGPELCSDKHASFNGRLGTQFEFNVAKNFSIMLEADANYKNDQYNLKFNDKCDWQIQAFIGLTYKFGVKTKKVEEPAPEPAPAPAPAPAPVVKKETPKPAPVVKKDEPLKETFFYAIRMSDLKDPATVNKIVNWCNEYPSKGITVSGYADKGTGNPRINKKYAEQRAFKVADAIKAKGISADRITVTAYGDTVQQFAENDQNRCVIVVGE